MLLRTADPFRDFDRLTQQILGTTNRPARSATTARPLALTKPHPRDSMSAPQVRME